MTVAARHDPGRMAHIDAMRAIAALSVAFFHFFRAGDNDNGVLSALLAGLFWVVEGVDLGRSAVLVFFIISGYVVARSVAAPVDHNVLKFAVRRLFRLFPMFWAALALHIFWYGGYSAVDIWHNILMVQVPAWPANPIVSVAWTLTIELVFYVLCAGLYLLGILQSPRGLASVLALCLIAALTSAVGRAYLDFHIPFEWPLFLAMMFSGALLRELDERRAVRPVRAFAFVLVVLLPLILVMSILVFWDEAVHQKSWQRHFNAYAVALIAFLVLHYGIRLRGRVMAYLGTISYSIYLLHPVVGAAVLAVLGATELTLAPGGLVGVFIVLVGTSIAAALTYHAVEAPAIALGRHLNAILIGRRGRRHQDVEDARCIP